MQPPDDSALLRQFADHQSDDAFAALVNRHINLVYSVALRQAGNSHNAEEITQAVFIILAKKAGQLRHDKALSSWLFQTTRLTANNFIRGELRRYRREEEAYMQSMVNESGTEAWTKIAPLLDSAVEGLRERDRRAIVLRFYEGRSLREVGLALGASEDAAEKRVNRALEKLRKFLARRSVHSTIAVIASAMATHSVHAAPAALAQPITAAAIAKGSIATASTLTLVQGTMKTMTWLKIKFAIGVAVAALLVGGTATVALSGGPAAPASAAPADNKINGSPKQVLLATIILKAPTDKIDALVAELDLANQKRSINPRTAMFQEFLKQHPDVNFLGAPQIITDSDQEAVESTTQTVQVNGTPAETGITVDAIPSLQPGSMVSLKYEVELRELVDGQPPVVTTKQALQFPPFRLGKTVISTEKIGGGGQALGAAPEGAQSLLVLMYATTVQQRLQKIIKKN